MLGGPTDEAGSVHEHRSAQSRMEGKVGDGSDERSVPEAKTDPSTATYLEAPSSVDAGDGRLVLEAKREARTDLDGQDGEADKGNLDGRDVHEGGFKPVRGNGSCGAILFQMV